MTPIVLCVSKCKLNSKDVCTGCGRNRQELRAWKNLSEEERREVAVVAGARMDEIREAT